MRNSLELHVLLVCLAAAGIVIATSFVRKENNAKSEISHCLDCNHDFYLRAVGQDSQGLSADELKGQPVGGIKLDHVSTINALTRALSSAQIPGGVATITTCGADKSHDLAPLGPTLGNALDAIVIADPQYRWHIDQGAVYRSLDRTYWT